MLDVADLEVSYGAVRAVDGVTLSVPAGTITAVLGANGAGKTSLLRAVNRLVPARRGRIRVAGTDVTRYPAEELVRLGVAHVPEGRGIITELTVAENLRLGSAWRRDRADVARDLDEVGRLFPVLAERGRNLAATLSGGERQMLAIARALMSRPRLLLLDEPSLGLAPRVAARIMTVVRDLRDDRGLTVLLVEQNARSALSVADTAVVLSLGRVVAHGDAGRLSCDDRLRHAYLGF